MGRDKTHPAEHDSSTRFIGSKDRKLPRVREERSRKLSNLALALCSPIRFRMESGV